ncbi:hypothetical protein, partial [Treponema primitia]|uniref:hypothetical protein n=1 Tax=Treponema primitia TaxID=88058 RepID=UPI00025558E1
TVIDVAGNSSHTSSLTRDINLDTTAPTLTINSPASINIGTPGNGKWAAFSTTFIDISGTAADAAPGTVTRILYYDADASETTPPAPGDSRWLTGAANGVTGATGWRIATNLTVPSEGNRHIWIVAEDRMGHRNTDLTYTNSATDIGTVATVSAAYFPYTYDKAAPRLTETSVGSGITWKTGAFTLDGIVGDSNALKSLKVTQTKDGDTIGAYTYTITLIDDVGTPDLTLKGLDYPGYTGGFAAAANWSTGKQLIDGTITFNTLDALPLDKFGNHVTDGGVYYYTIVATDIAEKTTILEREVIVDVAPPTVYVTNPLPEIRWFQGGGSIAGRVWDPRVTTELTEASASGVVSKLYYKKTAQGVTETLPASGAESSSGWSTASMDSPNTAKSSWSVDIEDADLEGKYTLHLYAEDQSGNRSPIVIRKYGIDKTSPAINILVDTTDTGGDASFSSRIDRDLRFKLSGTTIETNSGIQTFTIRQSKDGAADINITAQLTAAIAPGAISPSWELLSLPRKSDGSVIATAGADLTAWQNGDFDGVYTYTF